MNSTNSGSGNELVSARLTEFIEVIKILLD